MNKIFILLISIFLLSGCASGVALIGPATGAANGKIAQSTLKSAVSYGIKKQTGKSPLEHALAYAGEKNPNNKIYVAPQNALNFFVGARCQISLN